jgi:hypothetical protein
MLGIPVILSKITFSQIIADNKIGGTSVISIAFSVRISILRLSSAKYSLFASHLSGKNRKISGTKKTRESAVCSPLVYVALSFIAFSFRFLCPHFALPCSWYRKWAIQSLANL